MLIELHNTCLLLKEEGSVIKLICAGGSRNASHAFWGGGTMSKVCKPQHTHGEFEYSHRHYCSLGVWTHFFTGDFACGSVARVQCH